MPRLRADLHTHSHYSRDSVLSPKAYVDACLRKGITCAAVTDHNEVHGAFVIRKMAAERAHGNLKVIIGEEIKTADGEIIGLFLKELVPRDLSAEDTVRAIHEQGGVATIPHPFDAFRRNVIKRDVLDRIAGRVDAIEGWNCRNILGRHDEKARELAKAAGKPIVAGSDSHSPWEIGGVSLEIDDFETPAEFVQALAAGAVRFKRSLPMVHWISTYAKVRWRLGLKPTLEPLDADASRPDPLTPSPGGTRKGKFDDSAHRLVRDGQGTDVGEAPALRHRGHPGRDGRPHLLRFLQPRPRRLREHRPLLRHGARGRHPPRDAFEHEVPPRDRRQGLARPFRAKGCPNGAAPMTPRSRASSSRTASTWAWRPATCSFSPTCSSSAGPLINLHGAAPDGPIGVWQDVVWKLIEQKAAESGVLIFLADGNLDRGPVITYCRYSLRGPGIDEPLGEVRRRHR